MPKILIPFTPVDADTRAQLEYSLTFASEAILSYRINDAESVIETEVAAESDIPQVRSKIEELLQRYEKHEFGLVKNIDFRQERELPMVDAWAGLLERKWATPVGQGHVVLRGDAALLMDMIDTKVDKVFASCFKAELEIYPSTIACKTLDRCHHFTSFPEHLDFVSHLKQDLDVLNGFSEACRKNGWSDEHHSGRMAEHDFAISPSCCYHCYESMEGWKMEVEGRCITATLGCHRHEGANHRSLSRLRAFTMREVVWLGHPRYVIAARAKAEDLIIQWAKDWELAGTLETANDMFFTQDYSVKASFQRQQQAKKELRLIIPFEKQSISVFSSNFHAMTFGKAFNISQGGKPATSGCIGWGYERWIFAIFSQFGLDWKQWPAQLREEFAAHTDRQIH